MENGWVGGMTNHSPLVTMAFLTHVLADVITQYMYGRSAHVPLAGEGEETPPPDSDGLRR